MSDHVGSTRRIAEALRLLIRRSVATGAPVGELDEVAEQLEEAAGRLEPFALGSRIEREGRASILETHPIWGPSSALAPPFEVARRSSVAVATGTFGLAYEGAPGRVHGGFVAAGFDVTMGQAVGAAGRAGLTGTLTVRYLRPTPIDVPLRYEAEVTGSEGRKIYVRATLRVGDEVTAEAEGVWIETEVFG